MLTVDIADSSADSADFLFYQRYPLLNQRNLPVTVLLLENKRGTE